MSIYQQASDVRASMREGRVGQKLYASAADVSGFAINDSPATAQVATYTVDTGSNGATYTLTINSVDISVVAASGTASEIAEQLKDAINAEPLVRGAVSAARSGDDVVVTSLIPGESFTATESDNNLSVVATTANDTADAIEFGRAVIRTGATDDGELKCGKASDSLLSAQVITLAVAYVASVEYTVGVEFRGQKYEVQSTADTDQDTTITNLVAALNAVLPASSVVVTDNDSGSNDADSIIFTSEVEGEEIDIYWGTSDDGASHPAITRTDTTGPSPSTSLARAFLGISLHSDDDPAATVGGTAGQYAGGDGVRYLEKGTIWVESDQSISYGDDVYVELDNTSSDCGKFFNTASSTRALLAGARWVKDGSTASDSLAAIELQ